MLDEDWILVRAVEIVERVEQPVVVAQFIVGEIAVAHCYQPAGAPLRCVDPGPVAVQLKRRVSANSASPG